MPAHDTCTHDTDNPRAYYMYKSRAHERAAPARPPHTHRPSLPPAWPPHTHLPPGRWPRRAAARRRCHAAVVAAAGPAIAAIAAAAAELLAEDARMTAGADSRPVGRGGGLKQPPGRRSVACCSAAGSHRACDRAARGACGRGLWVPMRGKHARLAIGMMSDTCQRLKDSSQCTGAVSMDSDAMRREGRRSADQSRRSAGV